MQSITGEKLVLGMLSHVVAPMTLWIAAAIIVPVFSIFAHSDKLLDRLDSQPHLHRVVFVNCLFIAHALSWGKECLEVSPDKLIILRLCGSGPKCNIRIVQC